MGSIGQASIIWPNVFDRESRDHQTWFGFGLLVFNFEYRQGQQTKARNTARSDGNSQ